MNIRAIPGEETRFEVKSGSQLVCRHCHHEFGWPRQNKQPLPIEQCRCPRCRSEVEPVTYWQDVVAFWGHGQCACADFRVRVQPKFAVRDFTPDPCKHLLMAFLLFGQAQALKLGEAPQTT